MVCLVGLAPAQQRPRVSVMLRPDGFDRHIVVQQSCTPLVTHDGTRLVQSAQQTLQVRLADKMGKAARARLTVRNS